MESQDDMAFVDTVLRWSDDVWARQIGVGEAGLRASERLNLTGPYLLEEGLAKQGPIHEQIVIAIAAAARVMLNVGNESLQIRTHCCNILEVCL